MRIEDDADYKESQETEVKLNLNYGAENKTIIQASEAEDEARLNLTGLPIEIYIPNINLVDNDTFIKVRRETFGGSDSSVVLGVNPYKTKEELIEEKLRTEPTAEEKAISEKTAVKKGRDLEPLIIQKFQKAFKAPTIKPVDMYRFKDYPYLSMNFDGVTGDEKQYIPAEIKVVTMYGEKHYDVTKAMFNEIEGFKAIPEDVSTRNWSIENKAAYYGIPPYYYTQVQQEMMALNAPFGHLSVLLDRTWVMYTFYIYRDIAVQHELIVEGYRLFNIIQKAKAEGITHLKTKTRDEAVVQYMRDHRVPWAEANNAVPLLSPEFTNEKI
jgi:putative phage-type endonuclease